MENEIYIYRYIFLGFSSSKKKMKKKRGRTLNGLLPIKHEEETGAGARRMGARTC